MKLAIDSFAPYKSPGMFGIFPALLQEGRRLLVPYIVKIFRTLPVQDLSCLSGDQLRSSHTAPGYGSVYT